MIIGGMAVIARGVPRLTRDIDGTIVGDGTDLHDLLTVLAKHSIVPRIDNAVDFARLNQVLLLRHAASGIDVDLSLAWLPFELEAIAAAELVNLHGARVRLPRPEDLIIYKLVAWRPQDQQDVERLITSPSRRFDSTTSTLKSRTPSVARRRPCGLSWMHKTATKPLRMFMPQHHRPRQKLMASPRTSN
jgi:hypothetical protein